MTKMIICKDCFVLFSFSQKQHEYFQKQGWDDPIRCPCCRDRQKKRRQDPYDGWETTMGNTLHVRKGHRRVHYPPHVVGGFR